MPRSPSAYTKADLPILLQAYRNNLDAAERHYTEAERIDLELRRLEPDPEMLELMKKGGKS